MSDPAILLTPQQTKQLLENGNARLIDVREVGEYAQAHIDGAELMPLSTFDTTAVPADTDRPIIIHCRSGVRCGMASEALRAAGYTGKLHRLSGGILAWIEAGYPVIQDSEN